ncbi:hypothetical protein, partial [Tenacibaculum ovolyticum]|uniref:hypothetical protein n=1 Tax=Tenacibaculum ovolyticum TaxID=104270 RepID=UPI000B31C54A
KECGINYSNLLHDEINKTKKEVNLYSNFSDKEKGLWFSNRLSFTRGRNKSEMILVNHPAEAISHFNIYQEITNYCSFFESTSQTTINSIKKHIKKNNLKLKISTPNTKEAYLDDLKLILEIIKDDHIDFIQIDQNVIIVKIQKFLTNKTKLVKLMRLIEKFNKEYITKNIKYLGNSVKTYIKKDIIHFNQGEDFIDLKIPYTFQHISCFTELLLKAYPSEYISKIEKTEHIHWRKASQEYTKKIDKKFIELEELL